MPKIHHRYTDSVLLTVEGDSMANTNFCAADLNNADLHNADLHRSNLSHVDLNHANLYYADLSYADLSYADLSYADLRLVDLRYANLSCANLRGADLSYLSLLDSSYYLYNASFCMANLEEIVLSALDTSTCNLLGAKFSSSISQRTALKHDPQRFNRRF